jgi:ribosomal subunit interface protein
MKEPLQVSYRDITPSDAIEAVVHERSAKLDRFFNGITSCRILVESSHRRRHRGRLYHVRVELAVPGRVIVVNRAPQQHHEHEDVHVAIRDAFDAIRRRLEDYVRESRGFTKTHAEPAEGRIARLFLREGYGFIATSDGREVYFHRNAVLGELFDSLGLGTVVRFAEELGVRGPQATGVHVVSSSHDSRGQYPPVQLSKPRYPDVSASWS